MKNKMLLIFTILFVILTLSQNSIGQDSTLWHLPEGAKRRLGKGKINEVRYTADGMHIAVASSIGIWFYEAQRGKELDLLTGHTGGVSSIDFSPDGKILASGSSDGTICLWDFSASLQPEDVNADGVVDVLDLTLVASNFGKQGHTAADVNGDGIVDILDLALVASAFGRKTSVP